MGGNTTKERAAKIPFGDTPEDQAQRAKIFNGMDMNGNGYLSLAEIDKGVRDILKIPQLFETKPVMMRAFQAAKKKVSSPSPYGNDYITKATFKFLLIYLRFYYELWIDFDKIDNDGAKGISQKEFVKGSPILISEWNLKIDDPKATFHKILIEHNQKFRITFTDFCDYVISERFTQFGDIENHEFF